MKPIEPGCLAIIVGTATDHDGDQVSVLYQAPYPETFFLPDGQPARTNGPGRWVIAVGRPIDAYMENGNIRVASYGSIREQYLRRIDGYEEPTETKREETA